MALLLDTHTVLWYVIGSPELSETARNIIDAQSELVFSMASVGENVEIIEDYLDDKYSPSSLLLGFTQGDRALHIQVSRMESNTIKIITLYEPDDREWIDYRSRRK